MKGRKAADQPAFGRRRDDPHPGACIVVAGHETIERLADALCQEQRGLGLARPSLDLACCIFLLRAVQGKCF